MSHILTIAIPTFNRFDQLRNTLTQLRQQYTSEIKVEVFDNASTNISKHDWALLKEENPVAIFNRNEINIGLSANFIQCFLKCETDWLWVLSDDDIPVIDAVSKVLKYISSHKNAIFINFNSNISSYSGITDYNCELHGIHELIEGMTSFPNLLFISTSIFKASSLKSELKTAYFFHNTFAPHLAILFKYLEANQRAKILLSCDYIVNWEKPKKANKWNEELFARSIYDLSFLLSDSQDRLVFLKKANPYHHMLYSSFPRFLKNLALSNSKNEHELICEYYHAKVFLYWVKQSGTNSFSLSLSFQSILIFIFKSWLLRKLVSFVRHPNLHLSVSIYNKFRYYSGDKRL